MCNGFSFLYYEDGSIQFTFPELTINHYAYWNSESNADMSHADIITQFEIKDENPYLDRLRRNFIKVEIPWDIVFVQENDRLIYVSIDTDGYRAPSWYSQINNEDLSTLQKKILKNALYIIKETESIRRYYKKQLYGSYVECHTLNTNVKLILDSVLDEIQTANDNRVLDKELISNAKYIFNKLKQRIIYDTDKIIHDVYHLANRLHSYFIKEYGINTYRFDIDKAIVNDPDNDMYYARRFVNNTTNYLEGYEKSLEYWANEIRVKDIQ